MPKILKNNWKCILCQGTSKDILYKEKRLFSKNITPQEVLCTGEMGARGKHSTIWQCKRCGLIFQEQSFSQKQLGEAYSQAEDESYFEQFEQRKNLFKQSLARINSFAAPPGRLLDVGSGAGLFVSLAKNSGWQAEGIDPSIWASREAKKRFGVKVQRGTFENFKNKPASFDVITMWDVLEHYVDPLEALQKANRLLKKDGILALTTININSWFSGLFGPHWPWLIRIHLWYFTHKTLVKMLVKAGFRVEWIGGQTRWFSLPYLLSRFTGRNFSWLPKITLPAPTGDIFFVIARKK